MVLFPTRPCGHAVFKYMCLPSLGSSCLTRIEEKNRYLVLKNEKFKTFAPES